MKLLKDKVTIITGGSRGIGKSICFKFAEHGSDIIFTYNHQKIKLKILKNELKSYGVNVEAVNV